MKFKKYESTKYTAHLPDDKGYIPYTAEEDAVWTILINRQLKIVQNRACKEYLEGLSILALPLDRTPQCTEVSKRLMATTGWSVTPVPALISADEFFTLLSRRQFPAASFVRLREELDYLQEPDLFHELFGHCPMLTHPVYADFMQDYGKLALAANETDRALLARLYWFTVEFGLIQTMEGLKIYGGGILSSKNETIYALESPQPKHLPFSAIEALRTPYRIDIMQPVYFVLNDFEALYRLLNEDIHPLLESAKMLGEYPPLFSA